ncbi:hypothetical protein DEJ51_12975 [Streptomyces venezuelae]|uniref:Uncharacterized protein n=1 Tax=Streptomyces venezuelae TaxID=54571 RepID=A0A5P2DLI6_STRVZ|nr:hypothetical protein DEJ51_12975 [Streptomyces venezuelae]
MGILAGGPGRRGLLAQQLAEFVEFGADLPDARGRGRLRRHLRRGRRRRGGRGRGGGPGGGRGRRVPVGGPGRLRVDVGSGLRRVPLRGQGRPPGLVVLDVGDEEVHADRETAEDRAAGAQVALPAVDLGRRVGLDERHPHDGQHTADHQQRPVTGLAGDQGEPQQGTPGEEAAAEDGQQHEHHAQCHHAPGVGLGAVLRRKAGAVHRCS